jgi:hypothetical protein
MVGATNTEWLFIVDGDEWWPAEALRRLMKQEIPAGYNLGYSNLVVVRFDEGPGVEESSMGMVGGGPGAFRYAEPWSGQILMRVPGLVFSGEYPCEVPCWNADPKPYYAEKNLPKALDFHHLARSRMDAETPHRMEKRGIVAMHDVFQMPFDLGRWPNPYADRVKGR